MVARNFNLNTDYPFDKVMGSLTGNFTALARHGLFDPRRTNYPIAHDFGDYGLVVGVFSTNGADWLPFGVVNADVSSSQPTFQTVEVTAYCTVSDVVVIASNYLSSSQNIRYALQVLSKD